MQQLLVEPSAWILFLFAILQMLLICAIWGECYVVVSQPSPAGINSLSFHSQNSVPVLLTKSRRHSSLIYSEVSVGAI